jgi:hypothetical protein
VKGHWYTEIKNKNSKNNAKRGIEQQDKKAEQERQIRLTLSFLSLPASHLCHQGLG